MCIKFWKCSEFVMPWGLCFSKLTLRKELNSWSRIYMEPVPAMKEEFSKVLCVLSPKSSKSWFDGSSQECICMLIWQILMFSLLNVCGSSVENTLGFHLKDMSLAFLSTTMWLTSSGTWSKLWGFSFHHYKVEMQHLPLSYENNSLDIETLSRPPTPTGCSGSIQGYSCDTTLAWSSASIK